MDSLFVEVRGCDRTNLSFIERLRNFLGSLLAMARNVLDGEVDDLLPRKI